MKKFISLFITLSVLFSTVPVFNITVNAASVKYYETAKADVPLRYNYGSEYDIQSRITSKGTVVKIIDTKFKWTTLKTWHKVNVSSGVTNNGKQGDFWVYDGNLTKHDHKKEAGACTSKGCDYVESIKIINSTKLTMEVSKASAPMRKAPYNDGETVKTLKQGELLSITNKVQNYKGSYWYQISNGCYIFEDNVKPASQKKVDAAANSINNSSGGSSGSVGKDYFTPPAPKLCAHINWSVGKCVDCGKAWQLHLEPVTGTYKAKENGTVARDIPYKQGNVKKTYQKGDVVSVVGKAKNSAKNTWYQTSDGYWIYGVEEVTLKSVSLSSSGHTFSNMEETVQPTVIYTPSNVEIASKTWTSSNTEIATVNSNGVISPKGVGKATITLKVKSKEGVEKSVKYEVVVPELASLEKWEYNNQSYNASLALECVEYSALAYPTNGYTLDAKGNIILKSRGKTTAPGALTDLLKKRNFHYKVSNNYYNMTENNSPFTIATKKVNYGGKIKDVIYVIIEGSAGLAGWQGNMMMSGENYKPMDYHYTFNESAKDIRSQLDSYIKENNIKKPLVVITGHSRGAAAGNILAADMTVSPSYEKIYAYLFATPNTTKTPNKNLKNIINICNELDFVAYIPFSSNGWEFEKHGVTYSFNSKTLLNNNGIFADIMMMEYGKPDYNWNAGNPTAIRDYVVGTWKNVKEYYKHNSNTYSFTSCYCNEEAFEYFYSGLGAAASKQSNGILHMLGHLGHVRGDTHTTCPFHKLTCFFGVNGTVGKLAAFADCHIITTYHAAIYSKAKLTTTNAYLFSEIAYGNGSVDINQDEYDALYSFFSQGENELMLEVAGWDIEDSSTWEGIKWNTDGNIVSIDLSYLNLSGWFNANNFPKLQDLNTDGNSLTMLAVSECDELVNLSCMSNNLSSLSVNNCSNLQNLNCGFNQISTLDVSNMSQLSELNCYGNQINDLDLSGATSLQTVRCGNNELYTIDISTNINLNTFYCDNNRIVESQNAVLVHCINSINSNGGSAIIGTQKYNENYEFNTLELSSLTEFANMSLNLEKLGWDLEKPYTWQGVEWKIIGDEYHITAINFDGLDLEGDFNLPEAEYVKSVSCENSSLTTLNLSGCISLNTVNCYNSGISSLDIENCSALEDINCDENYLEIEDVESSLSQIGLSTGIATYENQNIAADEETFNQTERDILIAFLSTGANADVLGWDWSWPGTWDGIVWTNADGEYRVNKIDFGDKDVCGSIDLSAFEYLEDFDFSGSQVETVILPNCITKIPEFAFYNSGIKYIHMSEGVTSIEKSAFAYCDNLNTIVLPSTVTRILDNAFYESHNLKNLVFIGNEPMEVGAEIAHGTSSEFNIFFFDGSVWEGSTELLNDYSYITKEDDYIVLLDENIELKDDAYYSETNNYAGDDINVTIISKLPGTSATCLLSVYDELGGFNELASVPVELNRYMTVTTFEDVNVQYVGEEICTLKAFLWSNLNSLKPLTTATEKVLIKPVVE